MSNDALRSKRIRTEQSSASAVKRRSFVTLIRAFMHTTQNFTFRKIRLGLKKKKGRCGMLTLLKYLYDKLVFLVEPKMK